MDVISLQSGSNGNCFYVSSGDVGLLIDAGISGIQAETRLARHGIDIRSASAVLISHDHRDHIASAGTFQRKYKLPIYITRSTLLAARRWCNLGRLEDVRFFQSGDTLRIEHVQVHSIVTPHDGADG
ncbi:MAG TPA: MBL fold metallo-hydrolase, partial [Pirellulaceae bacterium]|nr:MBL fold metallo-hydrolase [Pirellulaceae bacterium]